MKKLNLLLLACLAFALNAKATEWPASYSFVGVPGGWFNPPALASEEVRADAQDAGAVYLGEEYTMPTNSSEFEDTYLDMFDDDHRYALDKKRDGIAAEAFKDTDGVPEYVVGYDDDAIYVFLSYAHDSAEPMILNDQFNVEIMFCPYDKLEYSGDDAVEAALWLRYLDLGGIKLNFPNRTHAENNPDAKFFLQNYMGVIDLGAGFIESENLVNGAENNRYKNIVELADCSTATELKTVLRVEFFAFDDIENDVPFTKEIWKAACAERGIIFEVKLTLDNNNEGGGMKRSYMWNSGFNDTYYTNSFAGYLKMEEGSATYGITVTKGVAALGDVYVTKAKEGATIGLISEEYSDKGLIFVKWTSENEADLALLDDKTSPVTTFVMPAHAVAFTATYWDSISTENATIENMSILDNQIVLGEAADVQIISLASGVVVLQVSGATSVPLSGLPAGVYIAKSGSEVIKFAK